MTISHHFPPVMLACSGTRRRAIQHQAKMQDLLMTGRGGTQYSVVGWLAHSLTLLCQNPAILPVVEIKGRSHALPLQRVRLFAQRQISTRGCDLSTVTFAPVLHSQWLGPSVRRRRSKFAVKRVRQMLFCKDTSITRVSVRGTPAEETDRTYHQRTPSGWRYSWVETGVTGRISSPRFQASSIDGLAIRSSV
jgi:hypothetical protein